MKDNAPTNNVTSDGVQFAASKTRQAAACSFGVDSPVSDELTLLPNV